NARDLGFAGVVQVRTASVSTVLEAGPPGDRYHVVLVDPPYPLPEAELSWTLSLLVTEGWLDPEAVVVVERSARSPEPDWPPGLGPRGAGGCGEPAVHGAEAARAPSG